MMRAFATPSNREVLLPARMPDFCNTSGVVKETVTFPDGSEAVCKNHAVK